LKDHFTVNNFQAGGKAQVLVRYREVLNALQNPTSGNLWTLREPEINFAEIVQQFGEGASK
jgi:hypothetical protein